MAKLTQSYAHGASTVPLIGETIGVHFDHAAARFGDRDALDRPPPEHPLDLCGAEAARRCASRRA